MSEQIDDIGRDELVGEAEEKIQQCLDTVEENPPTVEEFQKEKHCGVTLEEFVGALIAAEQYINQLEIELEHMEKQYQMVMTGEYK